MYCLSVALVENREEEIGVVGSEKGTKALSQRVWKWISR